MKRTEIKEIAVIGHSVELNHSELVVVKQFVNDISIFLLMSNDRDKISSESLKKAKVLLKDTETLLGNLFSQDVMSLDKAHEELFAVPVINEVAEPIADNEL